MQFYKVNCNKTLGNSTNPDVYYVAATTETDAAAAVLADAAAEGHVCSDFQAIPIQETVIVGN